jgi:hypothetical protein
MLMSSLILFRFRLRRAHLSCTASALAMIFGSPFVRDVDTNVPWLRPSSLFPDNGSDVLPLRITQVEYPERV